jgi:hypothetical protein
MNPTRDRQKLYALMGVLPPRHRRITVQRIGIETRDGYLLEKLVLDLNGSEFVPAYFVKPATGQGPFPVVLYNHAHGGDYKLGKDELIAGRAALQQPPYAQALTAAGYAGLCIDTWAFGERRGRTESEIFKEMLWNGRVMWGMMVYDSLRAVDYLCGRPDVDKKRIGTLGISMGSTMAWWLAALDVRIKVCVDICCLTDFNELIRTQGLDGHGVYYYVPGLLNHFSTSAINALVAPRPHLSLNGTYDRLTPPAGLAKIDRELKKVYARLGRPQAWKLREYPIGHFETARMRKEIMDFFKQWL